MHADFLVEDSSTAAAVSVLLSRLVGDRAEHSFEIQPFNGKERMLRRLPGVFRAQARAGYADRVIVVIDQDDDSCYALKQRIHDIAVSVGLVYAGQPTAATRLHIRIATTEMESWFIGDPAAVRAAYPRLSERDLRLRRRQHPDTMAQAWEWLHRRLVSRGYYAGRMPKAEVARAIAPHLDLNPDANASHSFRLFLRTLRETYGLD